MPDRDAALARIRLRHLQCFLAVAQHGNLRRAAQALSITQPAVTKTLNELEQMLGKPLFVRGRKGATLTPEAQAFLPHASASVSAIGRAIDSVGQAPGETPLRIGLLPTLAPSFMPAVLRRYAAVRPQAALRLHTGRNKQLVEQLRHRELDVVVGRLTDADAMLGVTFEPLYAEPVVIAVRAGHALARAATPARLAAWPLVLPLPGTMIRQLADGYLERHAIAPQAGVMETIDTALARALALGGDAVWFTPQGAAQLDFDTGALVKLAARITPEEPVGLMLPADTAPSPALQALVGAIRQQAAEWRRPAAPVARKKRRAINRK